MVVQRYNGNTRYLRDSAKYLAARKYLQHAGVHRKRQSLLCCILKVEAGVRLQNVPFQGWYVSRGAERTIRHAKDTVEQHDVRWALMTAFIRNVSGYRIVEE